MGNVRARKQTPQEENWGGPKGVKYADRFFFTPAQLDNQVKLLTGVHSRTQMNKRFLRGIPRDISILEIGCNVGNQLGLLHHMGFTNLHGIELHPHAVEIANKRRPWAHVMQRSALDLNLLPDSFDMVMTTWVLTHVAPEDMDNAMRLAGRCARRWIWGCEPWWPEGIELHQKDPRTGHGYLWKGNYSQMWRDLFPEFKVVRSRRYEWVNRAHPGPELEIEMFLLAKQP
jgi:pseudaminic acid biosynthesis-associated methylase